MLRKTSSCEKAAAMESKVFLKKQPHEKSSSPEKVGNAKYCFSEKLAYSRKVTLLKKLRKSTWFEKVPLLKISLNLFI